MGNAGTADGTVADALDAVGNVHAPPPAPQIGGNAPVDVLTSPEFWLSVILLGVGLVVIAAQLRLVTLRGQDGAPVLAAESGIRLSIVSLIIIGALVLIASGYSNNQIGPAMGLFGTIAGYLIGKQDRAGN